MKSLNEFITESIDPNPNNWPNVTELGDGEFNGALWGHCFLYEGNKYFSETGWLNAYPSYCTMEIKEGKAWPRQSNECQRPSLVEQFKD